MMLSELGLGHEKEGLRVHACVISFTDAHVENLGSSLTGAFVVSRVLGLGPGPRA